MDKITVRDLQDSVGALRQLGEQKIKDAKVIYAVTYNIRKVNTVLGDFDKSQRALITSYGKFKGDGSVQWENKAGFDDEIRAMLDIEINSDDFRTVTCEQLMSCGAEITPIVLANLWWMLDGELPEE